jgi:aconitate hydratase
MQLSGRSTAQIKLVEAYAKAQGMWHDEHSIEPTFTTTLELDLASVRPSMAGPKRPQDRVLLEAVQQSFLDVVGSLTANRKSKSTAANDFANEGGATAIGNPANSITNGGVRVEMDGQNFKVGDGSVVIAAITSCTNTSNPAVMLGAGLVAKKAAARGLKAKPWVKTSIGPGSLVVSDYLKKTGLLEELEKIGFYIVGYGCTTCIGNSGPLPAEISHAIGEGDLAVASVLSGNRNFEGRVHPEVKMNYLASPPLVVAYALAGTLDIDLTKDAIGTGSDGKPVYLKDIWPSNQEISDAIAGAINPAMFEKNYADVFKGDSRWNQIASPDGALFKWDDSTYIKNPPYFDGMSKEAGTIEDIHGANVLGLFGDSITTDHISPAGSIKKDSPAGRFLISKGVEPKDFNSYGSRRGNDDVMVRGTFANIRIKNLMLNGVEGGFTLHVPSGEQLAIYDAAVKYKATKTPLVVFAGKEYGTGSSRDWAAKGTLLLGVKAVIAESFERIHRSNLVGMGVLPCTFKNGENAQSLGLTGKETFDITGLDDGKSKEATVTATAADGSKKQFTVQVMLLTPKEREFFRHGGILQYVLRQLAGKKAA